MPRADRYGLLLSLLVLNYLLSAFTISEYIAFTRLVLFVVALHLALRTSRVRQKTARLIIAVTVLGTVGTITLVADHLLSIGLGVLDSWVALVLFVTVMAIVRRVLSHPVVSTQTILGALAAYLIIGLMFAEIYGALGQLGSHPFFAQATAASPDILQYFSFTTLTTLGYGDFTPGTNAGRAIAMLEALAGQIFLVTLVARLVSAFTPPSREDRGGRGPHRLRLPAPHTTPPAPMLPRLRRRSRPP